MLQNIVAISIAVACLAYVVWQGVVTLSGKRSKIGSCCAKGCGEQPVEKKTDAQVQFLPIDLLTRKR